MPLRVVSCCTYLTSTDGLVWRPADYDAHDFVMAIKAKPINGFCHVPCRGETHRIDDGNRDAALDLFARMIEDAVRGQDLGTPLLLVPVPNSLCDISAAPPRTARQAEALARQLGAGVWDGLRWTGLMRAAHSQSGSRDAQDLFDKLTAVLEAPGGVRRAALVDDTLTSGGHMRASAALIRRMGLQCDLAFAAGRSDRMQVDDPFSARVEIVTDFEPR